MPSRATRPPAMPRFTTPSPADDGLACRCAARTSVHLPCQFGEAPPASVIESPSAAMVPTAESRALSALTSLS